MRIDKKIDDQSMKVTTKQAIDYSSISNIDVVNSNDEGNRSEAPLSPSSGSQIYLGTAFDLDIRKDQSSSALNLDELVV